MSPCYVEHIKTPPIYNDFALNFPTLWWFDNYTHLVETINFEYLVFSWVMCKKIIPGDAPQWQKTTAFHLSPKSQELNNQNSTMCCVVEIWWSGQMAHEVQFWPRIFSTYDGVTGTFLHFKTKKNLHVSGNMKSNRDFFHEGKIWTNHSKKTASQEVLQTYQILKSLPWLPRESSGSYRSSHLHLTASDNDNVIKIHKYKRHQKEPQCTLHHSQEPMTLTMSQLRSVIQKYLWYPQATTV